MRCFLLALLLASLVSGCGVEVRCPACGYLSTWVDGYEKNVAYCGDTSCEVYKKLGSHLHGPPCQRCRYAVAFPTLDKVEKP